MIEGNGVEDSSAGFPPLPQARRRSFSDKSGKPLPSIFRDGREVRLQGVVVGNAGLRTEDWAPWRGQFP